jgi:hypothetical protein
MSRVTVNEMLLPSTFPSVIGIAIPGMNSRAPLSMAPSALKVKAWGKSPLGVEMVPAHLPSMSAAKAERASIRNPITNLGSRITRVYTPRLNTASPSYCGVRRWR